jgi:hypothetical protein
MRPVNFRGPHFFECTALVLGSLEDLKEIPVIVLPALVFALPLAKAIAVDESDRPVVDAAMEKIVVDAYRKDVALSALNVLRGDCIRAKF